MNVAPTGLAASAPSPSPGGDESRLSAERPFPGLRPFAFADRAFFFGRERQKFALYRLVENGRFIAVVGSSGSGKSSLVLAGLSGLLDEENANPGGSNWVCLDMRPGASPLKRLAKALAKLSDTDSADEAARRRDRIEYSLRQSSFSFESALEEAGGLGGRTLLLIVDQFEELFRFGLAGLGPRRGGIEETRARDEATQFVQILLDADRRRLEKVHVLITMRSDFIGECAYFHGLSEAVSATQYLVPNLTRGQIEEVIRRPIEEAGATIEPELVERLINDCGDELDQLPVLQHCLMRLWDRAGATGGTGPRRLTLQTYEDIGRMSDALSRHADEILGDCPGKQLAVEQAFRALSELDREGRVTRRALPFSKLMAETGVDESDLRAVLDRFRSPSCSFLVPPPLQAPVLAGDERLDIGHEALLRRWKKLSGEITTSDIASDERPIGWLKQEQNDAERYRTLVSMLDGEAATLGDPEGKKRWWDSVPRTAAWADRYGGRFADVRKLIDDSIAAKLAAKQLAKRNRALRVWAAAVAVLCVLGIGGLFYKQAVDKARQQQIDAERRQEEAKAAQEAVDAAAMSSAKQMLDITIRSYSNHTIDLDTAKSLATLSVKVLENTRKVVKTSAADLLWVEALDAASDLQSIAGDDKKALELATQAQEAARPLTEADPSAPEPLQRLYDATLRVGNTLAVLGVAHRDEALDAYKQAEADARQLVSLKDSVTAEADLIDAEVKIGDIYKDKESKVEPRPEALAQYRAALAACQAALIKFPDSVFLHQNEGKAYHRIAEYLRSQHSPSVLSEARDAYRKALEIQTALVKQDSKNLIWKSNLAATYSNWGNLEREVGDPAIALANMQQGVQLQEELHQSEPTNPQWETYLASNDGDLAKMLEDANRPKEAFVYFQEALEARRDIAFPVRANAKALREFAEAAKNVGDRSDGVAKLDAYHSAVRTWKRLLETPKSERFAAAHFDDVFNIAKTFHDAKDWPNEKAAYDLAGKIALWNFNNDPSDAQWKEKADAAMASAKVAQESPPPPPSAPQ